MLYIAVVWSHIGTGSASQPSSSFYRKYYCINILQTKRELGNSLHVCRKLEPEAAWDAVFFQHIDVERLIQHRDIDDLFSGGGMPFEGCSWIRKLRCIARRRHWWQAWCRDGRCASGGLPFIPVCCEITTFWAASRHKLQKNVCCAADAQMRGNEGKHLSENSPSNSQLRDAEESGGSGQPRGVIDAGSIQTFRR